MSQTSEVLSKVGLTETEVKVYEAVIAFSFRTAGQISYYTDIALGEVITTCDSLIQKNYLKKKEGKTKESAIYIPLAPKISISGDVSSNLQKQLAELSDNITQLWDKTQGTIDTDIGKLLESVEGSISNLSTNINQLSTEHQDGVENSNTKFLESVSSLTDKATETFEKQIQTPLKELSKKLTELSGSIESICNESLKGIDEANVEHNSKISEVGGELQEELDNYVESVSLFTAGRISGVTAQIENVSNETEDRVKGLTPKLVEKVDTAISGEEVMVEELNKSLPTNVLESFNSANSKILDLSSSSTSGFTANVNSIKEIHEKTLDETISAAEEVITTISTEQGEKTNSLQDTMLSAINTVQEEVVKNLGIVLVDTSGRLDQTKEQMAYQIRSQENTLSDDLNKLHKSLMEALTNRFDQVKLRLSDFISQLKADTEGNIEKIIDNVNELKQFLVTFLSETRDQFSNYLGDLQNEVRESLVNIVGSTNENLNSSVLSKQEELSNAETEIKQKISEFKSNFDEFLSKTNTTLESKLKEDQETFNSKIEQGISEFKVATNELQKHQADQLQDLNNDIKSLDNEAKKIEDSIQTTMISNIKDHKDKQIANINNNTNALVDKFSREFTRFNERLDRELNGFYDEFHDKSQGLRDEVPERIEGVFLDQVDRLDNFKRDFQRIMGHAITTLNDFVAAFSPDGKKIDKNQVPVLFQEVTRAQSDFKMFENQMNGHFSNTVDDTEEIKTELLTSINKTVQDELTVLEGLVQTQSKGATDLSHEFINSIKSHSDDFIDGMKSGTDETIAEIESAVFGEIVTLFVQPLKSVLSKSKAVATGSEDSETENRVLKTQNIMIEKIQTSVSELNEALKSSFESTITGLNDNLDNTKEMSNTIISGLNSQVEAIISDQKTTIETYKNSVQNSLNQVQEKINESISSHVRSTNEQLNSTIDSQTQKLEDSVSSGNNDLKSLTQTSLSEIDASLSKFQGEFDNILQETGSDVEGTIKKATDSQKISTEATISEIEITTGQALDGLNQARSSLSENVSQLLAKAETDVNNMVNEFQSFIETSSETLQNQVKEKFGAAQDNFNSLDELTTKNSESMTSYVSSLESSREQINNDLNKFLTQYGESRKEHISAMKDEFSSVIEDIVKTSSEFIVEIFDSVNTQIAMLQIEIEEYSKSSKDVINDLVTNSVETVRSSVGSASNLVTNAISEVANTSPATFNEMVNTIDSLTGDQESAILQSKKEFQTKVGSGLSEKGQEWKSNVDKTYKREIQKIESFSSDLKAKIMEQSESGKQAVTDAISKIPSMIDSALDAASKSMKLLSEISEGSLALEPSIPELSYFDASKEAILANLNGVIGRSKSSVTIVCPYVSWISPKTIDNFTRVSVKLITDLESHDAEDQKIMDLFKEKNINVDLRKLDKNRFRGDINMIMASRDKEEVIISKLPNSKAPYAFVSQDDAFIEKFNELLHPFQTMPKV